MKSLKNNQSGFTLIELLVVIIIVAVLAAVGLPLFRGNVAGARLTEADASLGTIRTAIRAAQAAGAYTIPATGTAVTGEAALNFQAGDLTGHYFEDNDYTFIAPNGGAVATTYCLSVTGDTAGAAPRGVDVNGVVRSMNDAGSIFASVDCLGTAVN